MTPSRPHRHIVALIVAAVVVTSGALAWLWSNRSQSTEPAPAAHGPLVVEDEENFSVLGNDVDPTKVQTYAGLVLMNRGNDAAKISTATIAASSDLDLVGVYLADPSRTAPGIAYEFPPRGPDGTPEPISEIPEYPAIAPGESALAIVVTKLAAGAHVGTLGGVRITYTVGSSEFTDDYAMFASYCRGDNATDKACIDALAATKTDWRSRHQNAS